MGRDALKSIDEQAAELVKNFQAFGVDADSVLLTALDACGTLVETQAALLAPVDTGLLRKSISHRVVDTPRGADAEIGTNVEYAPFQEFGTVSNAPQPFLTPALNEEAPRVEAIIRRAMKGAIDRV